MKRSTFLLAFLASLIAVSVPSHADSDAYFCASKGYLAYELREGITLGQVGHELTVVRFDPQHGIRKAGTVKLKDFQVHILKCSEDGVEIAGYGTVASGDPPLTTCVIDFDGAQHDPKIQECDDNPAAVHNWRMDGPEPGNLGQYAGVKSIPLESLDPDHQYQLVFDVSNTKVGEDSWETHYKTELIQHDARGNVAQRLVVYEARLIASGVSD
jgi:hypothetical protein